MDFDTVRKAGQALGNFFGSPAVQSAGKKIAFDVGTGLSAHALTSALRPQVDRAVAPMIQQSMMQQPMTQAIDPEQQAMPGNYADVLDEHQRLSAALEHQRYLQRLSLIQAEKQPTTVIHQNRQDLNAVMLGMMNKTNRYA